jgi:peroxin-5
MQSKRDDLDFGEDMQNAWQSGLGDLDDDLRPVESTRFDDEGIPTLESYKFGKAFFRYSIPGL